MLVWIRKAKQNKTKNKNTGDRKTVSEEEEDEEKGGKKAQREKRGRMEKKLSEREERKESEGGKRERKVRLHKRAWENASINLTDQWAS